MLTIEDVLQYLAKYFRMISIVPEFNVKGGGSIKNGSYQLAPRNPVFFYLLYGQVCFFTVLSVLSVVTEHAYIILGVFIPYKNTKGSLSGKEAIRLCITKHKIV